MSQIDRSLAVVLCGDNRALLPALRDNSVHSCVTDPPYALTFMGKRWDAALPGSETWAEVLRVVKPGGHLLAFGGTRTFHRLACAIEDAGWEIRDTLSWLYGSGFPKSLDVSKAMDKVNGRDLEARAALAAHIREVRTAGGFSREDVNSWFGYSRNAAHWESGVHSENRVPSLADWSVLRERLGVSDEFLSLIERVEAEREVVGPGRWNHVKGDNEKQADCLIRPGGKHDETAAATNLAKQWAGWGTALKPAWEPIILARKPLMGTVAANVAARGTGALNVDGCRIEGAKGNGVWGSSQSGQDSSAFIAKYGRPTEQHSAGRWPANVVLSHSPECREVGTRRVRTGTAVRRNGNAGLGSFPVKIADGSPDSTYGDVDGLETVPEWECEPGCAVALLDAQSGERRTGSHTRGRGASLNCYGEHRSTPHIGTDDAVSGASRFFLTVKENPGPSMGEPGAPTGESVGLENNLGDSVRFRYTAKASRPEREAGLEGMPTVERSNGNKWTDQDYRVANGERTEGRESGPRTNTHPCVKPLQLMRWLARLITPPGGLILDPFAGSGSTGCAAVLEGFRFLGIEQDEVYYEIARRRIAYWERVARRYHRLLSYRAAHPVDRPPDRPPDPSQIALFGEVA